MRKAFSLSSLLLFSLAALAQTSPFLPKKTYDALVNEISGDRAYDSLRELTKYHAPHGTEQGFWDQAQWIAAQARAAGLQDVRIIELPYPGRIWWTAKSAEAWLIEPGSGDKTEGATKLGSFAEVATFLADFSRNADIEADLIDVGVGLDVRDYEGKDVKGKIVLASGSTAEVEKKAVWERGAVGIVSYYSSRIHPLDHIDQIAWSRVNQKPDQKIGKEPSWAVMVSPRVGLELKRRLNWRHEGDRFSQSGDKEVPPDKLRVRVKIDVEIRPEAKQGIVEGWIRGASIKNQQVVLTSHVQEEKTSANDDRSGVANMLEIARALVRLINEGKLPRPQRDIRFWWANEISGEYQYFAEFPEERANIWVNVNQDMVGVNQKMGQLTRVQHVPRTPWSKPTFFNDVVESIVMSLYYGNNSYLAARQAGSMPTHQPFPRPIWSHTGSRDRYQVEIVPYFDSTDHLVFNDAFVNAVHGGTTFTNWPDEYIHSSADDIWQMDPTTFKRNAVAATAIAWYMANVGPQDARTLETLMMPAAMSRIARNAGTAAVASVSGWDRVNVIRRAIDREAAAIDSLRTLGINAGSLKESADKITRAGESLIPVTTQQMPQGWSEELSGRVPIRADIKAYVANEDKIEPLPALHTLMRYEALNFADGKRSLWDIYAALRAESLAEGEWYYGTVTPELVRQFFENAAKAGVVTFKEAAPAPKQPNK